MCLLGAQESYCCHAQGASGLTLAARLNQQALLPDMMFPTVNRFNPNNGQPLPISNGGLPACSGVFCGSGIRSQHALRSCYALLCLQHEVDTSQTAWLLQARPR